MASFFVVVNLVDTQCIPTTSVIPLVEVARATCFSILKQKTQASSVNTTSDSLEQKASTKEGITMDRQGQHGDLEEGQEGDHTAHV